MTISTIRNNWLRRSLVVGYGTVYLTAMLFFAVLAGFYAGGCCAFDTARSFLSDLFEPLQSAWRGRVKGRS